MPDTLPTHLGRFEILRALGQGGMGQVFLAKDPAIGREVALKTISSDVVQTPKARERFLNEAKAAGALSHPNLVTIHEFGEDQGVLYLVMEHLQGEDLSALLRRRALTPAQALEVMAQVCDGLAYAHARGVLHRDVKPSNVRVVEQSGRLVAKLLDFGVARLPDSQLTGTGDRVGTLSYMAPEYLRGGQPTVQCDLYPVGMMLHEALTGQLPSLGLTLPRGLGRLPARAPSGTATELPPRLLPLVHRALEADPAARFPSAEAFAAALRGALKQDAAGTERLALPPLPEPERRSRAPYLWLAALLVAGGGVLAWRLGQAAPPAVPPEASSLPSAAASPPAPAPAQETPAAIPSPALSGAPPSAVPPSAAPSPSRPADPAATSSPSRDPDAAFVREQAQAFAEAYRREDWTGLGAILDQLQQRRIDGGVFGRNDEVRQTMDADRSARRIPFEFMQRIRAYLPPPPGQQGQGPGEPPGGRPEGPPRR